MEHKLSERELEVIWTVAEYGSNVAAGANLGISEQTVKNHISTIIRKTGAVSALQAYHRLYQGRRLHQKTTVMTEYEEESA